MKRFLKIVGRVMLGLLAFVLLYAFAAYCFPMITVEREADTKEEIAIYILTNGVHTDLVVPVKTEQYDWSQEVLYANTVSKDSNFAFLALGWGDKGFYLETPQWKDLKASVAFKAAFALGSTAMHATYYSSMTEGERCKKIMVSKEQYQRLARYITDSFEQDTAGHFINIATTANYGKNSAFYEANGHYSMVHTCNTWANNALKKSGQKCCFWTPFDSGIFQKYK